MRIVVALRIAAAISFTVLRNLCLPNVSAGPVTRLVQLVANPVDACLALTGGVVGHRDEHGAVIDVPPQSQQARDPIERPFHRNVVQI